MNNSAPDPRIKWWEIPWYLIASLGLVILAVPATILAMFARLFIRRHEDDR